MSLFPDFSLNPVQSLLSVLYLVTILFICLMIIFKNKAPVKTLSWVMIILLIPLVGILLYVVFGQDYRKQKIFSRKGLKSLRKQHSRAMLQMHSLDDILSAESDAVKSKAHIMRLMLANDNAIIHKHNSVDILLDAEETFPAMLEAIQKAGMFVHMQFYRFEYDDVSSEFISLLIEKARAGVEVRVIFDDVGSWSFPGATLREMNNAGILTHPFMPVKFPHLTSKVNYRNHRKILVVDGVVGFIGGLNLARKYLFGHKELGQWRDTHLKVSGGAVAALNNIFLTDWYFVSGKVLPQKTEAPAAENEYPRCLVQIASSGPDSDWANIMQAYFSSIATATKSILISTPYFSPDESILNALKTSALSGVEVVMLLPIKADSVIADWNSKSYITELIESGIIVFLFDEGFNHSKYMIIDGVLSVVGSANVDIRSFELNFEVAALIYNEEFAAELTRVFIDDISDARQVIYEEWQKRPRRSQYKESLARILGPLY